MNSKEPFANTGVTARSGDHEDNVSYIDLGDCDQQCRYCGYLFWYAERLKGSNYGERPEYHLCYGGGKIYVPETPAQRLLIQQLLRNNHFIEHIQAYNQMFAMTSFGAKVDNSVNKGRGPYVFKVSGQIYHWIGSFCPEEEQHETDAVQEKYRDSKLGFIIRAAFVGMSFQLLVFWGEQFFKKYPLLFIFGQPGFYPDMVLKPRDGSGEDKKSRPDWVRKNQKDLRSDYLQGGPRYMYSHYLDALTICRSLGNLQYLITFTCNMKWPKIKRYMASYLGLTPSDRADIVCRVFEQKVNDFIKFLKYEKLFGYLTAWYKVVTELMMHGPCGVANPDAACTENRICIKNFPKNVRFVCDDKEWDIALEESAVSASSAELRTLFAQILIYCDVADPPKLWEKHWYAMQDDIAAKVSEATGIPLPVASSGIASLLLLARRTAHSRFKLPFNLTDESVKENPKKDKIETKPDKNGKHGETGKSQKQLQSSTKMPQSTIAALEVGQENCVLEAKVYQKWVSKTVPEMKPIAFCCILIDRELAATPATYYYINPQIPEAENAYTMFKEKYNMNTPLQVSRYHFHDPE
uniref:ATP-dependent DNA helicase n=1 Tax=Tanacetum cinerariifolium TaxID=118510 RepID=A0A6L2JJZ0_TANCI|nr:helitron helicase-like domain-containing protein [Tanacetum cinerariifolium]